MPAPLRLTPLSGLALLLSMEEWLFADESARLGEKMSRSSGPGGSWQGFGRIKMSPRMSWRGTSCRNVR